MVLHPFTGNGFEKGLNSQDSYCPSTQAANMAQIPVDIRLPECHGGWEPFVPPCNTGQLPVCACGWNFMSLRETWPYSVGARTGKPAHLGRHLLQGRGRRWFCSGSPSPEVCVRKGGVCFGETRAFFV